MENVLSINHYNSNVMEVIKSGVLKIEDIDRLKVFPKEFGVQRMIDRKNVDHIKESMKQSYITPIIKVNKQGYILDGQHTRQSVIELLEEGNLSYNNELVYVMYDTKGHDKEAIVLLNTTNKNWGYEDFLETWVNSGNENYIWFKDFQNRYELSYITSMYMVTGKNNGGFKKQENKIFNSGEMVITNEQRLKAMRLARQLEEIKELVPKDIRKNRNFQNAFVKIALNDNYAHDRMVDKLSNQYDRIHKCSSQVNYIDMLEDIYNYRSKRKVKFT